MFPARTGADEGRGFWLNPARCRHCCRPSALPTSTTTRRRSSNCLLLELSILLNQDHCFFSFSSTLTYCQFPS
jgi:hypothetical protein